MKRNLSNSSAQNNRLYELVNKFFKNHVLMQNAEHSKPYNGSALEYWEKKFGRIERYRCPHCDKVFKRQDLDGGHVVLCCHQDGQQWITPICKSFNESNDSNTIFWVDRRYLIPAP